jgi:hypothetical protein
MRVHIIIMGGLLGAVYSTGLTGNLNDRLVKIPNVTVRTGGYDSFGAFAEQARSSPDGTVIGIVAHSLGAGVACETARRIQRPVDFIYGFDPAKNAAADISMYRLTKVPRNVSVAKAVFIDSAIGLGGGIYIAENPRSPTNPEGTFIENWSVHDDTHGTIEERVERHLAIEETVRRYAEA